MASIDPIAEFKEEHRQVRDGLLELTDALQAKNVQRAREMMGQIDKLVGPHFRFEEEAFISGLTSLFRRICR